MASRRGRLSQKPRPLRSADFFRPLASQVTLTVMTSAGRAIARLCGRKGKLRRKGIGRQGADLSDVRKIRRPDELRYFWSSYRSGILFETSEACRGESPASPYANKIAARRKAGTSTKKHNLARKARSPTASNCDGRVQPTGKACTDTVFPRADRTTARLGGSARASGPPFERESRRSARSDVTLFIRRPPRPLGSGASSCLGVSHARD